MTMYQYPDYLYHFGVKGMKWGVRKRSTTGNSTVNTAYTNMRSAKNKFKSADKRYNKDFSKYYNNSQVIHVTKKGRAKNKALRAQANDSLAKRSAAKKAYKSAKKTYKESLDTKNRRYSNAYRTVDRQTLGKTAERNINRKMNKGQSYTRAVVTETAKVFGKSAIATLGVATAAYTALTPQGRAAGKKVVDTLVTSAKLAGGNALVDGKRTKISYL